MIKKNSWINMLLAGWGGKWEGGSRGKGHVYIYGWFMLTFCRNQYNSVKQLPFNLKINCYCLFYIPEWNECLGVKKKKKKNQEDHVVLLAIGSWLESQEDVCVIWTNLVLNHFSKGQFFTATNCYSGVYLAYGESICHVLKIGLWKTLLWSMPLFLVCV